MYRTIHFIAICFFLSAVVPVSLQAQNIFSGERVQVVGAFNGYVTTPYGTDYRTSNYRRVSVTSGTPSDGRGQWSTTINVQSSGGDATPINMPGGGGNGFLFISGPSANRFLNKWVFSGVGQGNVDGFNNISAFNSGNDMGLNMGTAGYYTFNLNDVGYTQTNAQYYVGYTAAAPVQPTRSSELLNPDGTATITITTSASVSAQEKVYVRYTLGADFSGAGTSSIVQATLSGSNYTAIIPAQTNGIVVRYYVFTSTRSLAQLTADTEQSRSLAALRFDDNSGANYNYTAGVLPVIVRIFTGNMVDDKIRILWVAEQEVNMQHYELYKSNNGVAFTLLKTVTARGNSSSQISYEVLDNQPNSLGNFYYLICVGRDNKRSATKILRVNYQAIDNQLTIYPNPVQSDLNISITSMQKGQYHINIYADGGQMVYSKPYEHNGFDKTLHLTLPETIKTGPYRIYISNKFEFFKGTFIVE
jgi:hypothetical protein